MRKRSLLTFAFLLCIHMDSSALCLKRDLNKVDAEDIVFSILLTKAIKNKYDTSKDTFYISVMREDPSQKLLTRLNKISKRKYEKFSSRKNSGWYIHYSSFNRCDDNSILVFVSYKGAKEHVYVYRNQVQDMWEVLSIENPPMY